MSKDSWNDGRNEELWRRKWSERNYPNGYWVAFGHLFKVLYSYHRLVGQVEDKEKVKLCSRIHLERYINPAVQGGLRRILVLFRGGPRSHPCLTT